jgi:protease I
MKAIILGMIMSLTLIGSSIANTGDIQSSRPKTILMPLPLNDFDPTEAAVTWKILREAGHNIVFATPNAQPAAADPIMVTGRGLGLLKWSMRADSNGRKAYSEMTSSLSYLKPISYQGIDSTKYDLLVLAGGHAKGMRPYLESSLLQSIVSEFMSTDKPVGAICHGVVLLARSVDQISGKSVLFGRKVTTLPNWMETLAYKLTKLWMGDYYKTYPNTSTQDEVVAALADKSDFFKGPKGLKRDNRMNLNNGFVVKDGNLITARWPGDAHKFGVEIAKMIRD